MYQPSTFSCMLISTKPSYHAKHTSILSKNIQIKPSSCGRLAHAANTTPMLYPATKTTACCVSPHAPVPRPSHGPTRRNAAKAKNPTQSPRSPHRCMRAPRKFIPTRTRITSIRWRPIPTGRLLSAAMICGSTGGTWTATIRASVSLLLCYFTNHTISYSESFAMARSIHHRSIFLFSDWSLHSACSIFTTVNTFLFLIPTLSFRRGGH